MLFFTLYIFKKQLSFDSYFYGIFSLKFKHFEELIFEIYRKYSTKLQINKFDENKEQPTVPFNARIPKPGKPSNKSYISVENIFTKLIEPTDIE